MKKRAVGYVRVSSIEQTKGTSLESQREAIQKYANDKDWSLGEIYADEGISGADMEKRTALLRLLKDAADRKFEIMICTDIDRFGRDLTDILINRRTLAQCGVEDHFTSSPNESRLGQNVRAVLSEEERLSIKDRTMKGRLRNLKKGIPQGPLPFNRKYDKETKEWGIKDERIKRLINWAAKQYLKGKPMRDIASELTNKKGFKICASNLYNVLGRGCGDTYTNTLKGEIDGKEVNESKKHKIPRILDESMIKAIRDRMERHGYNRDNLKRYVLNGFIFCIDCGKSLTGQTQKKPLTKHYKYYTHPSKKDGGCCPGYASLPGDGIENAVFKALYRHTFDVESFREAVAEEAPTEPQINSLKERIKYNKKELKEVEKKLDDLVEGFLEGPFERRETIQKKEAELWARKKQANTELEQDQKKLDSLPRLEDFERDVKNTRKTLLKQFQSEEHLKKMTFDQKRRLLHSLLDGRLPDGRPYGIYVWMKKKISNNKKHFRFDLYARIFYGYGGFYSDDPDGLDFHEWADKRRDEWRKRSAKRRKAYKTNLSTFERMDSENQL